MRGWGSLSIARWKSKNARHSNLDISTTGTAIISMPQRYPAEVVRYLFRRPRSSNPVCIGENRPFPPFDYTTLSTYLISIATESFIDLLPAISLPLWTRIKWKWSISLRLFDLFIHLQRLHRSYKSFRYVTDLTISTPTLVREFVNYINPK